MRIRSPLRYPGGKTRAVSTILKYIPKSVSTLCSPFFGGGSVEIACADKGITVHGYDGFLPLVEFWQAAIEEPDKLGKLVGLFYPISTTGFYRLQKKYHTFKSPLERAVIFYVLNRSSYSGLTLSGGTSHGQPRFTKSAIKRLQDFKVDNLTVEHSNFTQSIAKHKDTYLYLDPPYATRGRLYGNKGDMHRGFDHVKLAKILRTHKGGWLLSYNDCEFVRKLYKGHKIIEPKWPYCMTRKVTSELLIVG